MAKSLEDLGKNEPSPSSEHIVRLRAASKESRKRSGVGIEELGKSYEARKAAFSLHFNKAESGNVVFMNEGEEILAHRINLGWKNTNSGSFPSREYVRCAAYVINKDGAWAPTGKTCPFCILLGKDPRLLVLWAVADLRQRTDPKTHKTLPIDVRRVEMDHEQVLESIFQGIEIEATKLKCKPHVQYARFKVSRTLADKSLGCGDSWTMMDWVDPKLCEKLMSKVPDWKNGWPLFPPAAAFALCTKHVKVCDEHLEGEGYNKEGWERLQAIAEGKAPEGKAATEKKADTKPTPEKSSEKAGKKAAAKKAAPASKTLEDLAAEAPAETPAEAAEPTEPTLEELGDFPEKTPATEQKTAEAEPATEAATAAEDGEDEDDDFDPWGSEEG